MNENEKLFYSYKNKICAEQAAAKSTTSNKMEEVADIPTTKYLADYLYVVREDVPFRYYRKVSVNIWSLNEIIGYILVPN